MKQLLVSVLCLTLLLTGCAQSAPSSPEPVSQEPAAPAESIPEAPAWAEAAETRRELVQDLNLDGVGEADDEVYISQLQFGDYEDQCTVLRFRST